MFIYETIYRLPKKFKGSWRPPIMEHPHVREEDVEYNSTRRKTKRSLRGPTTTDFHYDCGNTRGRECMLLGTTDPTTEVLIGGEIYRLESGVIYLMSKKVPHRSPAVLEPVSSRQFFRMHSPRMRIRLPFTRKLVWKHNRLCRRCKGIYDCVCPTRYDYPRITEVLEDVDMHR